MKYIIISDIVDKTPDCVPDGAEMIKFTAQTFTEQAEFNVDEKDVIVVHLNSLTEEIYDAFVELPTLQVIYFLYAGEVAKQDAVTVSSDIYEYQAIEDKKKSVPVVNKAQIEPVEQTVQDAQDEQGIQEEQVTEQAPSQTEVAGGLEIMKDTEKFDSNLPKATEKALESLLNADDSHVRKSSNKKAKVLLFGSSKGGTGKTFTCLLTAYHYAKVHPNEKIALVDFDIIDGQVGIVINKLGPTLYDYYKRYKAGNQSYEDLEFAKVKNDQFTQNIDFYLAPPQDIQEITENKDFWQNIYTLLLKNYDIVFFDTGIDYLGKSPISMVYKGADKILLTCNPSINSVRSILKQIKTLKGLRQNKVFTAEDALGSKISIILTRVSADDKVFDLVVSTLQQQAPICAAFGNMDNAISKTEWYQDWHLWDNKNGINRYLDEIAKLEG